MPLSFTLDTKEKEFLGQQARASIQAVFDCNLAAEPAEPEAGHASLTRELGSFVTLSLNGHLRGCIGTIIAHEALWLNVWNMARAAAFQDPRFPPLTTREWPQCAIDISVLDQPTRCPDPDRIEIGRDGLILRYANHTGVFLPQVPVEQHWNLKQYLDNLCVKANVPIGSWKQPDAELYWYQAEVFTA